MTDPLREAVNTLTRPTIDHIPQTDDDGHYLRTHTVVHEPLLVQLETAITSAIGNGGGGGSATGNVLNGEALYRTAIIRSAIGDWCHIAGIQQTRNMVTDLTRWCDVFDGDTGFHIGQMRGWVNTIRNLLDPPKRVPVDVPCPVCKATKWANEDGDTSPNPVVFEYRPEDPIGTARATCRACGIEWDDYEAVEELGEELAEKEAS